MSDVVIEAKSLNISIGNNAIIKNLNFTVHKGEVFALLGGNGAGKSTTLKTFLGLIQPQSGMTTVLSMDTYNDCDKVRQKIAYLPESVTLYPHLNAFENIHYFLSLAGIEKTDDDIKSTLERVSLQPKAWLLELGQYSKGMRQKTAIALALLREAPILFLDEPTSGLDPVAIDEFNNLIEDLASSGSTILMVTHDVYGACQVANRIGLLRNGELVGLYRAPDNKRIDTQMVHAAFAGKEPE